MITAVSQAEDGQSVIEFIFLLPALVGMAVILIRITTVMQISIVSQQYARAQTLFKAYNSPFYPELKNQPDLISKKANQMVFGVSDTATDDIGNARVEPEATVQLVARSKRIPGGSNAEREEPLLRSLVRVRNTVTLCTQIYHLGDVPLKDLGGAPNYNVMNYNLFDGTKFTNVLCRSQLAYE